MRSTSWVDEGGRLYWDGKRIEVTGRLTRWQAVGGFIVGAFIVLGAIGSCVQAWVAFYGWIHPVG